MNAQTQMKSAHMKPVAILDRDITPDGSDYEVVRRVIEKISLDYRDQPSLELLANDVGAVADRAAKAVHALGGSFAEGLPAGGHARPCAKAARQRHALAGGLVRSRHVRARPPARPLRDA